MTRFKLKIENFKFVLYFSLKRLIDSVCSIALIIIFLPFSAVIAIAIKRDSEGPIFADTPKRVGRNGKPFKMYKFRSMICNAHEMLRTDPKFIKLLEEYKNSSFKLKNDPRITSVGRFIRKHSLDEIPQFINVFRGEMSLVGPRAYYPDELAHQQKEFPGTSKLVTEMLTVKPGITGVWQVSGRSDIDFDKRIKMDAQYARKRSIWYDINILLKTPWAMVVGKGAM